MTIEETINRARVLIDEQRWPRYTLTLNPDDAIAEIERMAKLNRFPFDHIVASGETLVALARHVVGPEEAERLRLEIEALEHDATPSDIRAEHDATPSEKGNG